jgi:regulator of sigma E protease
MQIFQSAITIALFILILGALIVIHEFGHFVTARLFGMRVHEFAIGMGPLARKLRDKGETLYTLRWLPIGGYVRLEGEDGDSNDPRSFGVARLWKQIVVLFAGVAMNLFLAFAIFTLIAWLATPFVGMKFATVQPNSPAAAAGLQPGDTIVSVDGERFEFFGSNSILTALRSRGGQQVEIGMIRNGARVVVAATLRSPDEIAAGKGALGVSDLQEAYFGEYTGRSLGDAVAVGADQTVRAFGLIWNGLASLVSSIATNPTQAPPVSGPIGIASMVGQVFWQAGPIMTLYLAAILSANLALVNALPFPPLDGGRVLVLLIKAVLGRSAGLARRAGVRVKGPSAETAITAERLAYLVGFVFLFGFIIWISVFDIARLGAGTTP